MWLGNSSIVSEAILSLKMVSTSELSLSVDTQWWRKLACWYRFPWWNLACLELSSAFPMWGLMRDLRRIWAITFFLTSMFTFPLNLRSWSFIHETMRNTTACNPLRLPRLKCVLPRILSTVNQVCRLESLALIFMSAEIPNDLCCLSGDQMRASAGCVFFCNMAAFQ